MGNGIKVSKQRTYWFLSVYALFMDVDPCKGPLYMVFVVSQGRFASVFSEYSWHGHYHCQTPDFFRIPSPAKKKSRILETPTLSTDRDSRTDTILERLRDLSLKEKKEEEKNYPPSSHPSLAKGLLEWWAIWNTSPFLGLYSRPQIRTRKRTRSTKKFGLGPLWNTSPFLGLYSTPPIRTEKMRSRSTLRWGLRPRKNADSVHSGTHPRF